MYLNLSAIKWQEVHKSRLDTYISGYLTRLLSVITFSITENDAVSSQMGEESVKEMKRIFAKYDKDRHIICHLELCPKLIRSRVSFESNSSSKDKMSRLVHEAFEAYTEMGTVWWQRTTFERQILFDSRLIQQEELEFP